MTVSEQWDILARGAEEILPEGALEEKLKKGYCLRVKTGFDPTAPDLHLGHLVLMRKMRHFQECGHQVIFLIGDFTAAIGDPSGRDTTRPSLSAAEITSNAETYAHQVFKILDAQKTEIRRNSEWFGKMTAAELIRLSSSYTVARMLERNDFANRFTHNRSISLHEFLYPLVQGYDSLMLKADVELGGTDQKFNLMMGRELQRQQRKSAQCVLTMPLLEGLDGQKKMSKSLDNHIGLDDGASDMYGKLMSISDDLMWRYYDLLSSLSTPEIAKLRVQVEQGKNPMEVKQQLAAELTTGLHGLRVAKQAAEYFYHTVMESQIPQDIRVFELASSSEEKLPPLYYLLKVAGLCASSSEGKRLIEQGAVRLDGVVEKNPHYILTGKTSVLLQGGKRKFVRLRIRAEK